MKRLEWKPSYSVNNDAVDKDHKGFFKLAQELGESQPSRELFGDVLERLEQYATDHFAREEALMTIIKYPGLDAHIKSHKTFIDWLAVATRRYHSSAEEETDMGRQITEFVENWLVEHILKEDMRYRDYVLKNF